MPAGRRRPSSKKPHKRRKRSGSSHNLKLSAAAPPGSSPAPRPSEFDVELVPATLAAPPAEPARKGLRLTAELLFEAGARAVIPGIHGLPARLTSRDQASSIETGPSDPACYSLLLTHLFGTARMSMRPTQGVVGADFAVHGTKDFYVIDSSIFPTNLGVNPQNPIMGIAMHATKQIADRFQPV